MRLIFLEAAETGRRKPDTPPPHCEDLGSQAWGLCFPLDQVEAAFWCPFLDLLAGAHS